MIKNNELNIRLLDDSGFLDELIQVEKKAFEKSEDINFLKTKWKEKHDCNPYGKSFVFAAFSGDKIVGINCFQMMMYKFNGSEIKVAQSCQSCVLQEYRGLHIFSKIVSFAMNYFKKQEKLQLLIGFPNPNNSYYGFLKLGWDCPFDMQNLLMMNNSRKLNKKNNFLFGIFNLQRFIISIFGNSSKIKIKDSTNSLDLINIDLFHQDTRCSFDISKDLLDYQIKYKNIKTLTIFYKDAIIGNLFYTVEHLNNLFFLRILSINLEEKYSKKKSIYCKCLKILKKLHPEATFVRFWTTKSDCNYKMFKQIGFIKHSHKNPFILYPLNIDDDLYTKLKIEKNWNLHFFDLDY